MVFCPGCYSNQVKKYGLDRKSEQKYMCTSCGKQFTLKTDTYFLKMRYPKDIIAFGLTLHARHNYTFREVAEHLKERGVDVSHVTVHDWAKKFSNFISSYKFKPYSDVWSISESWVTACGEKRHIFIVSDSNGNILSARLSDRKTPRQTELAIKDAIDLAGLKPKTIMGAEIEPLVARGT